jgi:CSLREA domain-containing protein
LGKGLRLASLLLYSFYGDKEKNLFTRRNQMNKSILTGIVCILFVCFALGPGSLLPAATFTVNTEADTVDINPGDGTAADAGGNCSLRAAVMEANALYGPDIIELPTGTYNLEIPGAKEDHCRTGDLDICSNLTIRGAGKEVTIIDANHLDRIFHIKGAWKVTISDLTIQNGQAPDGKDLPIGSPLQQQAGKGANGGGILNFNGRLTLENLQIVDCAAGKGGQAEKVPGSGGHGGGIYNTGTLDMSHCEILENKAGNSGGTYNIYNYFGSDVTSSGSGGGIYNNQGEVTLNHCQINKNTAGDGATGGAWGGGYGGGICSLEGSLTIYTSSIQKNGSGSGGGFYEDPGPGGWGGGIYIAAGELYLESCTISENRTGRGSCYSDGGWGGGIACRDSETKILNCTISSNFTGYGDRYGPGGGIYQGGGKLSLLHCTITRNRVGAPSGYSWGDRGGGVCIGYNSAPPKVKNTIIANNRVGAYASGPDYFGTIQSLGYNLIGDPRDCTIEGSTVGNLIGLNAQLGPLADNGGPTMTHALAIGSPAIDAADPDSVTAADQRGVPRPADGNGDGMALPDIGAYERSFPTVEIVIPQNNDTVRGVAAVRVDVGYAERVEFYIDGHLTYTAEAEPYDFDWDTTLFTNGKHRIKAAALDIAGQKAEDEIVAWVDNVIVRLNASRQEEKAWLVRKLYGKLAITLENTGATNVSRYVIERKEGEGNYHTVKEIPASEFQGNTYTYHDIGLNTGTAYTYRVLAVDGSGMVVGRSAEKTI